MSFQLSIRAYDGGTPPLESIVQITVQVTQMITVPPESGIGFAELEHRVQLSEAARPGSVIKTLTLSPKPSRQSLRVLCEIDSVVNVKGKPVKAGMSASRF